MAVLVTGATGFVGRHLVAELEQQGMQVTIPPRREIGPATDWEDSLRGVRSVVHLAAVAHSRAAALERSRHHEAMRRVNSLGTQRLAQAAARAGVERMIFLSTIGVHGEETAGSPFTEESPLAPQSLYAASKLEAEQMLAAVSSQTGLAVTVLRPTLVYGAGNPGNMLALLKLVDRGWPLPLGSVNNRRSLTYVGNLVSAITAVLRHGSARGHFIVCDAEAISTPDLVRWLAAGMERSARLLPFPSAWARTLARVVGQEKRARRLLGSLEADSTKLARAIGWRATFPAAASLVRTGAWFRTQESASRG